MQHSLATPYHYIRIAVGRINPQRDALSLRKTLQDAITQTFGITSSAVYVDVLWMAEDGGHCVLRVQKDDASKILAAIVACIWELRHEARSRAPRGFLHWYFAGDSKTSSGKESHQPNGESEIVTSLNYCRPFARIAAIQGRVLALSGAVNGMHHLLASERPTFTLTVKMRCPIRTVLSLGRKCVLTALSPEYPTHPAPVLIHERDRKNGCRNLDPRTAPRTVARYQRDGISLNCESLVSLRWFLFVSSTIRFMHVDARVQLTEAQFIPVAENLLVPTLARLKPAASQVDPPSGVTNRVGSLSNCSLGTEHTQVRVPPVTVGSPSAPDRATMFIKPGRGQCDNKQITLLIVSRVPLALGT
ncbi:hypothetical protein LshimejAT787_1701040 [Lyophyllum shimeji]|uniref:Ribonucleases P/MRP subunit Pop8-like domain-containing protein n=1 Tax=Lyophyllum shimeji TaxID=47721 RepID=A0A9P3Q086_LYOSH|nr:hypothetical protein LshimejAT787_1701040 [Lyophyllum shimeji]